MSKITPEHLGRGAFVYVRQSTADQVLNNHESRRRQYGLVERAQALGWNTVEVIDDDLGRQQVADDADGLVLALDRRADDLVERRFHAVELQLRHRG